MDILRATHDPNLFAPWFRDRKSWLAWEAFLAALFGLPMTDEQLAIYRDCTGRSEPPVGPQQEAWLVCGRRAGKSFNLALIAVYLACFFDYRQFLQPGERASVIILAVDRKQARTIFRYIRGLLTEVPMLARMVERETADEFDLNNRISIEVGTASYKSVRGRTVVAALADEIAFYPTGDDAAEPDYALLDALRPAMATIPNAMLLCASSPYARRGALWDAYRRWYGKDDAPALVWKAASRTMNPSVPQRVIDVAMDRDEASGRAEYLAEFRADIESLLNREAVEAVTTFGCYERPYDPKHRYRAFIDPSGGSSDSFCLGIAHAEGDVQVLDLVRERKPPFSPEAVALEFADLMKVYGIHRATSDRYGGEFVRELFRKQSITIDPSALSKSEIYGGLLPVLNSGQCDLLDNERLRAQLIGLERRVTRGTGREIIDHAPGASNHDDLANAAAGALVTKRKGGYDLAAALGDEPMPHWMAIKVN